MAVETTSDFDIDGFIAVVTNPFDPNLVIVPADDAVLDLDTMSLVLTVVNVGAATVEPETVAAVAQTNELMDNLGIGTEVDFDLLSDRHIFDLLLGHER